DLDRSRRERAPAARPEGGVEVTARKRQRVEEAELGGGRGERGAAGAETPGSLGARGRAGGVESEGDAWVRRCHWAIAACRACSSIWTPWTSDAPPRMAEAT